MSKSSNARQRALGAELRRRREAAGINGLQLAQRVGWSPSTVSRIESGQYPITEMTVIVYLAHCGVSTTEAQKVLREHDSDQSYLVRRDILRTLILHETTASTVQMTAPLLVPGLLQTEDYTRAVMELHGLKTDAEVEAGVEVRRGRQALLRRRQPPIFTYYLYEAALRCPIGGNRVMNEQMLHLAFLSGRPHVSMRVVRFQSGGRAALAGQMMLMDFADHDPVLYLESPYAGLFAEHAGDIAHCRGQLVRLGDVALNEEQSRELLVQLASEYDQPDEGDS